MDILTKARDLRKNLTDAEKILWQKLRNRQLNGYKFKRQVPIDHFIVDFICSSARLIIELDGGQHAEQVNYDQKRSEYLKSKGFTVIRFWNNEVLQNLEGVLDTLTLALSLQERGIKR
ncbi:MAG: endonuclease domain-containing protein [Gammaproteobacteria bacterium]|nr:endonuclease domain-containing protein [Gammaproteobacteria bacterium]